MTQPFSHDAEMFRFFEMTPDLVCIASKDGYFKHINEAVVKKLGYTREELFAMPITDHVHPDDRELTRTSRLELLEGRALINFDNRYLTKSREIIWLNWTSIYIPDREVVFAIAKDITERKQAEMLAEEQRQQMKSLATHFKASMENDKKHLAAELHEQLAQLASTVAVDLSWLKENISVSNEKAHKRIEHAQFVSQTLIEGIRKISYDLSPGMVNDMGLNETLRWLTEEFTRLNGIPCTFKSTSEDENLSSEVQLDLYRICQELLKEIATRREARKVVVTITPDGDFVNLDITEDAKANWNEKQKIFSGIRQRAASIQGKLTLLHKEGEGTDVNVRVPRTSALN